MEGEGLDDVAVLGRLWWSAGGLCGHVVHSTVGVVVLWEGGDVVLWEGGDVVLWKVVM